MAARKQPHVSMDVGDILKRGLHSVVSAYCEPCCVQGCDKLSLDGAVVATGASIKCASCGKAACQGHYFLTPTVPPVPYCIDCLYKDHRVWRREKGLDKVKRKKDFIDAEFVETDKE